MEPSASEIVDLPFQFPISRMTPSPEEAEEAVIAVTEDLRWLR